MTSALALLAITAPASAWASCGFGTQVGSKCIGYLTSGSSWTVPSDWSSSNNSIEAIGGGGGGGNSYAPGGGGGGAYSKITNLSLTPGAPISYSVGSAGGSAANGGDTWFSSTSTLLAKGGGGTSSASGGAGGASTSGAGSVKYSGGTGGSNGGGNAGGGGGGAAGPNGNGQTGGNGSGGGGGGGGAGGGSSTAGGSTMTYYGGAGGNGPSGTGGGAGGTGSAAATAASNGGGGGGGSDYGYYASAGGPGTDWDSSHGAGGGGGGGPYVGAYWSGQPGGLYGGGGGSYEPGAQGIIVISYTPGGGSVTTNYTYDTLGRLTCAATSTGYYTDYTLDAADNRTQVTTNTSACVGPPVANYVGPVNINENSSATTITPNVSGSYTSLGTSGGSHGTPGVSGSNLTYTPYAGYTGPDTFQYTATNSYGTSAAATVSVSVVPVNSPPVANSFTAPTILANSSGNTITPNVTGAFTGLNTSGGTHGTPGTSGTNLTYTPFAGYTGTDSFQYTATNSYGTSSPATVTVKIAPIANNVSGQTVPYDSSGTAITLSVTGSYSSVGVPTNASHGVATPSGTTITYVPTAGYSGSDSFQYTATNGGITSSAATASLTVGAPSVHVSPTPSWATISGSAPVAASESNPAQTIQGIQTAVTLQFNTTTTTSTIYHYEKNGGSWTIITNGSTFSVSPGDSVAFEVTRTAVGTSSGTITIVNESDSNTTIGSFTFSVTATSD